MRHRPLSPPARLATSATRYLLDTDVLSEPLKPAPDPGLIDFLKASQAHLSTAAPVWHELVFGCARLKHGKRKQAIEKYLLEVVAPTIPVLPYGQEAARRHGQERARLEGLGTPPPFVDGQIAAIALVHDLVIVTKNAKHYKRFKGIRIHHLKDL